MVQSQFCQSLESCALPCCYGNKIYTIISPILSVLYIWSLVSLMVDCCMQTCNTIELQETMLTTNQNGHMVYDELDASCLNATIKVVIM